MREFLKATPQTAIYLAVAAYFALSPKIFAVCDPKRSEVDVEITSLMLDVASKSKKPRTFKEWYPPDKIILTPFSKLRFSQEDLSLPLPADLRMDATPDSIDRQYFLDQKLVTNPSDKPIDSEAIKKITDFILSKLQYELVDLKTDPNYMPRPKKGYYSHYLKAGKGDCDKFSGAFLYCFNTYASQYPEAFKNVYAFYVSNSRIWDKQHGAFHAFNGIASFHPDRVEISIFDLSAADSHPSKLDPLGSIGHLNPYLMKSAFVAMMGEEDYAYELFLSEMKPVNQAASLTQIEGMSLDPLFLSSLYVQLVERPNKPLEEFDRKRLPLAIKYLEGYRNLLISQQTNVDHAEKWASERPENEDSEKILQSISRLRRVYAAIGNDESYRRLQMRLKDLNSKN